MKNSFCPECKQLLKNRNVCNCGWKEVETQVTDHYCHYRGLGLRCWNSGTVSNSPYGCKWECSKHFRAAGNRKLCEEILLESQKNIKS